MNFENVYQNIKAETDTGKPNGYIRDLKKTLRTNGGDGLNNKSKTCLHMLWGDLYDYYRGITVRFVPTSYARPESVAVYVRFPAEIPGFPADALHESPAFFEDFLLRRIAPEIEKLNRSYDNENKAEHLIGKISCQGTNCAVMRRSGLIYDADAKVFVLKLRVMFPLGGGSVILGARTARMISDFLKLVDEQISAPDRTAVEDGVRIYRRQQEIRAYLKAHDLVAFVADGSVLPRKGDSDLPLDPSSAVPFVSPPSLAHTVTFSDGEEMRGMGIPRGVTVITGAGFSGKTTLLDAVESGIYDHIPGDGREYVIADPGTLTVNAEDGRYVGNADLSPFFHAIPGQDVHDFTTKHASGSVSQAANIVEAAEAGARLLLIDEDRSAANFMLRDAEMRLVVPDEIIIPFTDRILELKNRGISVLLVIGGSGEYLKHADRVILVEEYRARDITESVRHIAGEATPAKLPTACWSDSRTLLPPPVTSEGIRLRSFHTEKLKKVALNEYSSDITDLSAIVSDDQIHTLAYIIEQILTDAETSTRPLMPLISEKIAALFPSLATEDTRFGAAQYREWFLDEVRATEVYCCLTRMRGFAFRAAESRS